MIRLTDAYVLARTKLRVHKVRTWVAISVSGALFGLLVTIIIVSSGVFASIRSFSEDGYSSRYLLQTGQTTAELYNWDNESVKPEFISAVETTYTQGIAARVAEAKRLSYTYDPKVDDPSPITVDPVSKKKSIAIEASSHWAVEKVLDDVAKDRFKPVDITTLTAGFDVKNIYEAQRPVSPTDGAFKLMKDGKEHLAAMTADEQRMQSGGYGYGANTETSLSVVAQELATPFIISTNFDASKNQVPVIVSYGQAEKALGLEALPQSASPAERMSRLREVREKIGTIESSFCYRNTASQSLVSDAITQKEYIEKYKNTKEYVKPTVIYELPGAETCGEVKVVADTRTAQQKADQAKKDAFDKVFNGKLDPVQQKIAIKVVGVSPSYESSMAMSGVSGAVSMLLGSFLSSSGWAIPDTMLASLPKDSVVKELITKSSVTPDYMYGYASPKMHIIELASDTEARAFMEKNNCITDCDKAGASYTFPYGGSGVTIAEARRILDSVLLWIVIIISIIAAFILAGTIGRTIAEGRRETAIFRAIGARRMDISLTYTIYTLMLAVRIMIFAAIAALVVAVALQVWIGQEVTLGAQYAFGTTDYSKTFSFVSLTSPYLLVVAAAIIGTSLLAMSLPLLRNVRRNPIRDMRDDS